MTTSDRFTILIAALSLLFVVLTTGLGLIMRITSRWTRIEDNLTRIADRIDQVIADGEHSRAELDRKIDKVDSRLERHEVWHDDHPYLLRTGRSAHEREDETGDHDRRD